MIYLLAHIFQDLYRYFRFSRTQSLVVVLLLVVISPRFRRNFWKPRLRYSLDDVPPEQRHGGILVARTLQDQGVKTVFTLSGGHISPMLVACKVRTL